MEHLNDQQLTAYRDGEMEDQRVADHVRECASCRRRLSNLRLAPALLRRHLMAEPHLSDELLGAYAEGELDDDRFADIDRHIAECAQCLSLVLAVADALDTKNAHHASACLLQRVDEFIRGAAECVDLGIVYVKWAQGLLFRGHATASPPSVGSLPMAAEISPPYLSSAGEPRLCVHQGEWKLTFSLPGPSGTIAIVVEMSGRPASRCPVTVKGASGRSTRTKTDHEGRCLVSIDDPPVWLQFGVPPACRLQLWSAGDRS